MSKLGQKIHLRHGMAQGIGSRGQTIHIANVGQGIGGRGQTVHVWGTCVSVIIPPAEFVTALSDTFLRTVDLDDPPGHDTCEDLLAGSPSHLEIDPDVGMTLHNSVNLATPEISGLPLDFVVGIDPVNVAAGDLLSVKDFEGNTFFVDTTFAMAAGPHIGETRLAIYRANNTSGTDVKVFLPALTEPYFMRILADVDALRVKVWPQTESEPDDWTAEHAPALAVTEPAAQIQILTFLSSGRFIVLCGFRLSHAAGYTQLYEIPFTGARSWYLTNTYATSFGGSDSSAASHFIGDGSRMGPGSYYIEWGWVDLFQPASSAEKTRDGQTLLTCPVPLRQAPPDGTLRGRPTTLTISGKIWVGQSDGPTPSGEGTFDIEIFEVGNDGTSTPTFPVAGTAIWSGTVPDYVYGTGFDPSGIAGYFPGFPDDPSMLDFVIVIDVTGKDYVQLGARITDEFADLIATRGPDGIPLIDDAKRGYFIGWSEITSTWSWDTPAACG